ncbi:unnamed protein product, partial [Brenthis ino]
MSRVMYTINSLLIFISLFVILVATTVQDIANGYCDAKSHSCAEEYTGEKYILYDVNPPEGFNLRRDVYMRFAIMLSEARKQENKKHWSLVLPPWYNLYHWKHDGYASKPIPWSKFFDVESLKSFAPVVELHEIFSKTKSRLFTIDRLYVLQNYEDAFEGGEFKEKWEISNHCNYYRSFWDYNNITVGETICVKFQGKISKLWDLVALHPADKYVMFDHGEIPLHEYYGDKNFWNCRKSMKFNRELVARAKRYILENLQCNEEKCDNYLSVHWRRQDFARLRRKEVPSVKGTAKQIDEAIKKHNPHIVDVFLATDAQYNELEDLENQLKDMGYKVHFFTPSQTELVRFRDGGIAIIDQIICSRAVYFIGTHESTFSFRIQEEREILGYESSTTFNRLCPDSGKCEKPSKWSIVN